MHITKNKELKIRIEKPSKSDINPDECLTTGQAAWELSLAPGTLQNWRSMGIGPKFFKHRNRVFYLKGDIQAYKEEHFVFYGSTAEWKESKDQ